MILKNCCLIGQRPLAPSNLRGGEGYLGEDWGIANKFFKKMI